MKRCKKHVMDLPDELLLDIFLRMPAETLCRTKLACKSFLNIIDDPSFVRQHTLSLLATKKNDGVAKLVCLINWDGQEGMKEKSRPLATLQSLRYEGGDLITKGEILYTCCSVSGIVRPRFTIDFVFYNLICMSCEQDGRCWLINPLRKEVLTLPNDNIVDKFSDDFTLVINYGMGYDDITDTYKIVRVSRFDNQDIRDRVNVVVVHILVLGTNIWREIPSTPLPFDFESLSSICAYGDMHWFTDRWLRRGKTKEFIISFDFEKEEFSWTCPPPGLRISPDDIDYNLHLLRLSGSMTIAETYPSKGGTQVAIWVMNDYAKKEWIKNYDLNFDMHLRWDFHLTTCDEWEHGVFFNDATFSFTTCFLDLRDVPVKIVALPLQDKKYIYMTRYTTSLISLRDFGPSGYKRINDEPNL